MYPECIQNLDACFVEFGSYPFPVEVENPQLSTLQSGVPASPELVKDFKTVKEDSEKQLETFLDEHVYSKQKSTHARIKKMNRKSFASSQVIKDSKDKKMKLAEMEQNALKSVIDVVQKSEGLSLEDMLKHRVTEENTALFNPDGSFRKTAKSQLITKMNTDLVQLDEDYIAVVDMGMIWRLCLLLLMKGARTAMRNTNGMTIMTM